MYVWPVRYPSFRWPFSASTRPWRVFSPWTSAWQSLTTRLDISLVDRGTRWVRSVCSLPNVSEDCEENIYLLLEYCAKTSMYDIVIFSHSGFKVFFFYWREYTQLRSAQRIYSRKNNQLHTLWLYGWIQLICIDNLPHTHTHTHIHIKSLVCTRIFQ